MTDKYGNAETAEELAAMLADLNNGDRLNIEMIERLAKVEVRNPKALIAALRKGISMTVLIDPFREAKPFSEVD